MADLYDLPIQPRSTDCQSAASQIANLRSRRLAAAIRQVVNLRHEPVHEPPFSRLIFSGWSKMLLKSKTAPR